MVTVPLTVLEVFAQRDHSVHRGRAIARLDEDDFFIISVRPDTIPCEISVGIVGMVDEPTTSY